MGNKLVKLLLVGVLLYAAYLLVASDNATPGQNQKFAVKRLQEKAFFALKSSPSSQVDYYGVLLDKRLGEMDRLVDEGKTYHLWSASLRYTTTAGELTQTVTANNLTDKAGLVREKFKSHQQKLKEIRSKIPVDFVNEDWKYVDDGVNYLNLYLEQLAKVS